MKLTFKNRRPAFDDRPGVRNTNLFANVAHHGANRGEAIARWRLSWEIDRQDWHPREFDGRMETWFYTWDDFTEYRETLLNAQAQGMCRNVAAFERTVTVGQWREF